MTRVFKKYEPEQRVIHRHKNKEHYLCGAKFNNTETSVGAAWSSRVTCKDCRAVLDKRDNFKVHFKAKTQGINGEKEHLCGTATWAWVASYTSLLKLTEDKAKVTCQQCLNILNGTMFSYMDSEQLLYACEAPIRNSKKTKYFYVTTYTTKAGKTKFVLKSATNKKVKHKDIRSPILCVWSASKVAQRTDLIIGSMDSINHKKLKVTQDWSEEFKILITMEKISGDYPR